MNFDIPCETYLRLANAVRYMPDNVDENQRKLITCVRLERKAGHTYALASNRKIAAIYYFGQTAGDEGAVHLQIDKDLIKQCETEKPFNSAMNVTSIPALGIASIKTTLGYNHPKNIAFFPKTTPLDDWRNWGPDKPVTKTNGAMSWSMEHMLSLNAASPSGMIAFPEFIDANKPVVVRDLNNPNFMGLFMGNRLDDNGNVYTVEPAQVPEWFK